MSSTDASELVDSDDGEKVQTLLPQKKPQSIIMGKGKCWSAPTRTGVDAPVTSTRRLQRGKTIMLIYSIHSQMISLTRRFAYRSFRSHPAVYSSTGTINHRSILCTLSSRCTNYFLEDRGRLAITSTVSKITFNGRC